MRAVAESRGSLEDDQGSNTVVLRLAGGDEVWTSHYDSEEEELYGDRVARGTSFTGVLLYELEV